MSLPLAPGYTVRAPRPDDANSVHTLTVASDIEEFGEDEGYTTEEILDEWGKIDLDHDAWLVIAPDGSVAGYAYLRHKQHVRLDVEAYVHPKHFGCSIGTTVVRLGEGRAREHVLLALPKARVVLHNWINGTNKAACTLLEREGYHPVRYFLRMETAINEVPVSPIWPEGIAVRTFEPGDEQTYYAAIEEAMSDHWGHVPLPFEDWKKRRMGSTFDPSLWFLAVEGDEPAGVALCSISGAIGWVDILGVRRPWRRRGLGMALLRHALAEFHQRGMPRVALGVDAASPTGATRLYERAGMHMTRQHATYGKEIRPGEDVTAEETS